MGRRKRCVLAMACLLTVVPQAGAVHVIPAVDLPSVVPDSVRDQTARSLARGRDTLGWALHPFRGEFHGLGVPADGYSYANDLSADGRVVVGSDYDRTTGNRGYVWSPATGKVNYNLLPNGSTGQTRATTISADGVYAAGNITAPYDESGFRWSLAGRELISPPGGTNLHMAAISGNGGVTVGTATKRLPVDTHNNNPDDADGSSTESVSQAFRYTRDGGVQEIGPLTGMGGTDFFESTAVDVTRDGQAVLVNGFSSGGYLGVAEPFLWSSGLGAIPLGTASPTAYSGALNHSNSEMSEYALPTYATSLSADRSTVVGHSTEAKLFVTDSLFQLVVQERAVVWKEDLGWYDLGDIHIAEGKQIAADIDGRASYEESVANAVSADGRLVVGHAIKWRHGFGYGAAWRGNYIAFLWDEQRGMRDLEDVFSLDYGLDFEGWTLSAATGISDDGTTIIGNGINPDGVSEAWRAVLDRNTPDGDFDFDGDVDHHDYQTLKGNLGLDSDTYAVFYADGDLNADGRVDQADSDAFLSRYENRWMGDFNADGLVDLADYTLWRDLDGLFTGGLADSNGDGWANQTDLAAWRTHFGMAVEAIRAQAVPEPAALALLSLTALGMAAPRRSR